MGKENIDLNNTKMFEEWGFDALHVSGGVYGDYNRGIVSPMSEKHAWLADAAGEVQMN